MSQYTNTPHCARCQKACEILKVTEEIYPGQFTDLFLSSCCEGELVDEFNKFLQIGEIKRLYETQESYKLYPFMD